jgi:hypothetical protein
VLPHVLVELLTGQNVVVRDGPTVALSVKRLLQFLITNGSGVLVRNVMLRECLIRDAQDEIAVPFLGIDDTVSVVSALRAELESEIFDLCRHGAFEWACARATAGLPGAGTRRWFVL